MPLNIIKISNLLLSVLIAAFIFYGCNKDDPKNKISTENTYEKTEPDTILYYRNIIKEYPETYKAREALFMIAFVYDEVIKDKIKAKESYQIFLEKYPKDRYGDEKMSESARMMLQMLEENRSK